jgi:hypothetical protein
MPWMKERLRSFLLMLSGATEKELAQQGQFLKEDGFCRLPSLFASIVG